MNPPTQEPEEPDVEALASEPLDEQDAELLADLARLYDLVDPVPAGLVDRVGFTLTLANLEIELASLSQELREPVGARGVETARTITFSGDTLSIMLTTTPTGRDSFRVDGWLAPGGSLRVELRCGGASRHTDADEDGRFEFEAVPKGLMQVVVHPTETCALQLRAPVVTHAVEL